MLYHRLEKTFLYEKTLKNAFAFLEFYDYNVQKTDI